MRIDFQSGVHEHATAVRFVADRTVHNLPKERLDSFQRRGAFMQPDSFTDTLLKVMFQRSPGDGAVVAKRVLQTEGGYAHLIREITDRRSFIALALKSVHGKVQNARFV